jgi:hypothetical protein
MRKFLPAALIVGALLAIGTVCTIACETVPKAGVLANPSNGYGYPIPLTFSPNALLDGGTLTSQVFLTGGQPVSAVVTVSCPSTGCTSIGNVQILVSDDQVNWAPIAPQAIANGAESGSGDAGFSLIASTGSASAAVYLSPAPFGAAEVVVYSTNANTDGGVVVGSATLGK